MSPLSASLARCHRGGTETLPQRPARQGAGTRFFMDWGHVTTALDAVPVASERPAQLEASWPSQLQAAAFAATMKGLTLGGDLESQGC